MSKGNFKKLVKDYQKKLNRLPKRKGFRLGVGAAVIFSLLYLFKGVFIAAFVNGQPIGRLSVISELERRGGGEVLDTLITQTLIEQEAKRQNVSVTQSELEATIAEIEASFEGQGGLDQILTSEGMTRDNLEKQIRLQKLVEKMLTDRVGVTDEEVAEYLEENSDLLPEDATDGELNELARNQLEQQKLSLEVQTWLADLRQNANINYFVNY